MKIWELLSDKSKWIKDAEARDDQGRRTYGKYSLATCWCLIGAVDRCYPILKDFVNISNKIRGKIKEDFGAEHITAFNDSPYTNYDMIYHIVKELDV